MKIWFTKPITSVFGSPILQTECILSLQVSFVEASFWARDAGRSDKATYIQTLLRTSMHPAQADHQASAPGRHVQLVHEHALVPGNGVPVGGHRAARIVSATITMSLTPIDPLSAFATVDDTKRLRLTRRWNPQPLKTLVEFVPVATSCASHKDCYTSCSRYQVHQTLWLAQFNAGQHILSL